MQKVHARKRITILVHMLIGWSLCGAIMGVGSKVTTLENTLVIHAIGVPIIFSIISFIYFKKFDYTTPLQTAMIFVSFIILMDFFIVALLVEKSLDMFTSIVGTWIPLVSIFLSTYLVGLFLKKA